MNLKYSTGTTLDPEIERRLRTFLKGKDTHDVRLEIAKALTALKNPSKGKGKGDASSAAVKQNVLEVCLGIYAERTKQNLDSVLNELVNDRSFSGHADIAPLHQLREKIESGVTWETLQKGKAPSGTKSTPPPSRPKESAGKSR